MPTDLDPYFDAIDATWPASRVWQVGAWTLRDGAGGGKRVSAATLALSETQIDLTKPEMAMTQIGQDPLFMVREGQAALDDTLARSGYVVIDPVNVYAAPVDKLAEIAPPRLSAFNLWPPLAIQHSIWEAGGIGPSRFAVMARASGPKTALFGRQDGRPAAAGFAAIHNDIAMVHALEVLARHRRQGVGRNLTRHAARWARVNGARVIAVLCTDANAAANALYLSMGFTRLGGYHYRGIAEDA
ncbi:MAG: GNAT family N-acetyltransferase [Pseudomonadota bacterium]